MAKKRKPQFGRTVKHGGDTKAGTNNKGEAQLRDSTAAAAEARAAAIQLAETGASAQDRANAAAAVRATARDAVRAKAQVASRKAAAAGAPSARSARQPRVIPQPPQAAEPAAAAPAAAKRWSDGNAEQPHAKRPKPGQPPKVPGSADEQRQAAQARYYQKQKLKKASADAPMPPPPPRPLSSLSRQRLHMAIRKEARRGPPQWPRAWPSRDSYSRWSTAFCARARQSSRASCSRDWLTI